MTPVSLILADKGVLISDNQPNLCHQRAISYR
jgi:hypothetical protein